MTPESSLMQQGQGQGSQNLYNATSSMGAESSNINPEQEQEQEPAPQENSEMDKLTMTIGNSFQSLSSYKDYAPLEFREVKNALEKFTSALVNKFNKGGGGY